MTMRDPEVVDLLRDEPELLALADALADTQRAPRRVRGLAPKLAAVAAVAAGIAAAVLFWPAGGTGNGVLGRALAAIGDGQVLHLVMQGKTGEVLVDLQTGERRVQTSRVELWTDRSFERAHFVMHIDGQATDILLPQDAQGGSVTAGGTVDPVFTAFWTGYRKALEDGSATVERSGTIAGRAVYWLRFASSRPGVPGTEVAIDQESYKPVVLRSYVSATRSDDARILVAETIPYDPSDFTRVGPSLLGGSGSASSSGSSGSVMPQTPHPVVTAPWLTPRSRAAGLSLASVGNYSTTAGNRTIEGIELRFGDRPFGPDSLTIDELPRPDDPRAWQRIPEGWISIQKGQGSDGRNHTFDTWTGQLVKDGVYVTIETSAGENAVLEVARALRPAP
jgi:hypothetical protein